MGPVRVVGAETALDATPLGAEPLRPGLMSPADTLFTSVMDVMGYTGTLVVEGVEVGLGNSALGGMKWEGEFEKMGGMGGGPLVKGLGLGGVVSAKGFLRTLGGAFGSG